MNIKEITNILLEANENNWLMVTYRNDAHPEILVGDDVTNICVEKNKIIFDCTVYNSTQTITVDSAIEKLCECKDYDKCVALILIHDHIKEINIQTVDNGDFITFLNCSCMKQN